MNEHHIRHQTMKIKPQAQKTSIKIINYIKYLLPT